MRERRTQANAKQLRRTMTKAEIVLWTVLKGRALDGWKFRRQHPIGPFVVDFACVEACLIVEVDGATHAEDREIERDDSRTEYLRREGFTVLRVTNNGIYEDLDGVVRLIADALAPLGPSGHSPRKRGETSRQRLMMFSPACGGGVSDADGGGMKQAPNLQEDPQ